MTRQGIDSDRQRIYAIGDIHGRLDLLERAIEAIGRDVAERGPAALTITIGDYIDRGPQSRGVVDRLIDNPFPTQFVALKGNHEEMLEAFLADPAAGPHWAADDTKKHPCGCYCLPHICASGCSCRKSNAGPEVLIAANAISPKKPIYLGFAGSLRLHWMKKALERGWDDKVDGPKFDGISERQARNYVAYVESVSKAGTDRKWPS